MTTALYRRYRPDTFNDVIGQDHVIDPLRAALRADRVTHAYLFSGPRGCGKTTSARILARCLNCAQGPTDTPCGTCPSCVELATGGSGSLDVVEIDAASHGGVDDARELRERASFAPIRDRFKIFIIDEAHMVTPQGFNALLKIVEEPPEHVKFIFATTEPERVIGTIRSRTHHYPFRLVPPDVLEPYLQSLCEEENIDVGQGVLKLVMRAGGGSVRDSLSVLDQLMAGSIDGHMTYRMAVSLLGYTDSALLDDSVTALASGDGAEAYRVVERMVESGHDPRRFVEDLLQRLRDLLILSVAGEQASDVLAGTPADQLERMQLQAQSWGRAGLSRAADLTDEALRVMVGATSPRLQLELLIGRILVPAPSVSERRNGSSDAQYGNEAGGVASPQQPGGHFGAKEALAALRQSRQQHAPNAAESSSQSPRGEAPPHESYSPQAPQVQSHPQPPSREPGLGADASTRQYEEAPAQSAPTQESSVQLPRESVETATSRPETSHTDAWDDVAPRIPGQAPQQPQRADERPGQDGAIRPNEQLSSAGGPNGQQNDEPRSQRPESRPVQPAPTMGDEQTSHTDTGGNFTDEPTPTPRQETGTGGSADSPAQLLHSRWADIIQRLAAISRVTFAQVGKHAKLGPTDEHQVVLRLPNQGLLGAFMARGSAQFVSQAIREVTGLELTVIAEIGDVEAGTPEAPAPSRSAAHTHGTINDAENRQYPQGEQPTQWISEPPPFEQPASETTVDDASSNAARHHHNRTAQDSRLPAPDGNSFSESGDNPQGGASRSSQQSSNVHPGHSGESKPSELPDAAHSFTDASSAANNPMNGWTVAVPGGGHVVFESDGTDTASEGDADTASASDIDQQHPGPQARVDEPVVSQEQNPPSNPLTPNVTNTGENRTAEEPTALAEHRPGGPSHIDATDAAAGDPQATRAHVPAQVSAPGIEGTTSSTIGGYRILSGQETQSAPAVADWTVARPRTSDDKWTAVHPAAEPRNNDSSQMSTAETGKTSTNTETNADELIHSSSNHMPHNEEQTPNRRAIIDEVQAQMRSARQRENSGPTVIDDDSASIDDDDIEVSQNIGLSAVLDILGGQVIDNLSNDEGNF